LEREPKAERKRRSAAEVCTSEARKIGEALAPREGSALRKGLVSLFALVRAPDVRVGVAGRNRPAEVGAEDNRPQPGGAILPTLEEGMEQG